MSTLSFDELRAANLERLPQFKNSNGGPAHSKPDGSDWTPADWLGALIGEVGELCDESAYRTAELLDGTTSLATRVDTIRNEAADVQTYLDLYAVRAFDAVEYPSDQCPDNDPAHVLLKLMAALGAYANYRKKFLRGDLPYLDYLSSSCDALKGAASNLEDLTHLFSRAPTGKTAGTGDGFDLGEATMTKFNKVSNRVGCNVYLRDHNDGAPTEVGS